MMQTAGESSADAATVADIEVQSLEIDDPDDHQPINNGGESTTARASQTVILEDQGKQIIIAQPPFFRFFFLNLFTLIIYSGWKLVNWSYF